MASEFDVSIKELDESVMEDMKKIYSQNTIEHFLNPRNLGQIQAPDGFGRVTGHCGDTMEIYLRVKSDKIANATFWTDGCGPSIASGSMVTEMAKGKNVSEARRISRDDVLAALGGLPEESKHCALLAATTVKKAIEDYLDMKREPWKRAYRR